MRKSKLYFIVAFIVFLSFTSTQPLIGNSPRLVKAAEKIISDNTLSSEVQNELKFRQEFGLDTNLATVQFSLKTTDAGAYGVHLLPEEEEQLTKRFEFQQKTNPILIEMLSKEFNNDFTLYIDQSNNGTYYIGLKEGKQNIELLTSQVNSLFTDEYKFEIKNIFYSEKDLDDIATKILDNQSYLEKQDIAFNQVYTDVVNEKVIIGVEGVTEKKISIIRNLFGDIVEVREAVENSNNNRASTASVMKGGLKITYAASNKTYRCSVGFMVQPPGGAKFIVTAGHCKGTQYKQGTNSIGSMTYYKNSGSVDAGMVGGGPSSVTYTGGVIYRTASLTTNYDRTQNATEDVVGEVVCMSGASTDTNPVSCGTLNSKNFSGSFDGISFTKLRKASYTSADGDSGGTVYGTTTLKGVNKGSSGTDGVYSHLELVMDALASSYGSDVHILY